MLPPLSHCLVCTVDNPIMWAYHNFDRFCRIARDAARSGWAPYRSPAADLACPQCVTISASCSPSLVSTMFYSWVQHHSMFTRCSTSAPGGPRAAGARASGSSVRVLVGRVWRAPPAQRQPDAAQVGRAAGQRALRSRRAHRAAWRYAPENWVQSWVKHWTQNWVLHWAQSWALQLCAGAGTSKNASWALAAAIDWMVSCLQATLEFTLEACVQPEARSIGRTLTRSASTYTYSTVLCPTASILRSALLRYHFAFTSIRAFYT